MPPPDPPGAEYYQRYYADYSAQNPPYKLAYYRELAQIFAPARKGLRILDVGCAFGDFLSALPSGWVKAGLDTNAYAVAAARKRFPNIAFERVERFCIPFAQRFDVITAFDVLEHVGDLENALSQIHDALGEGGVLIAVVPVYDGPLGPLVRALDKDPTHVHKQGRKNWIAALSRRFRMVHYEGTFRFLVPGAKKYVHAHSLALRAIAPAVALVARRT